LQHRTQEQIAWAAGLFEGEGWFGPRAKTSAEAVVGMTDLDVVERFATIMGFGALTVEPRGANKTLYRWSACNATDVRALIELFWPYFGERRREAAQALLARTQDCPGKSRARTACRKGHPYTDDSTYTVPKSGFRQCRICKRERERERAAAKS
jgi:hypothetical protein